MTLLFLSVLFSALGAFGSLWFGRDETRAIRAAAGGGAAAALLALATALPALRGPPRMFQVAGPYPFAHFVLRIDPFAALMLAVIAAVAFVAWIYSLAYVAEYRGRGVGAMGFFMNSFIAAMMLVVCADNAFWFLVFFEMMSLASYFLVIFDQDEDAIGAGYLYFLVAHAGSVLVMLAFFLMASASGSFDFAGFRAAPLPVSLRSIAFLLGCVGFGAKAGVMPLHAWLPRAHPAAPSHASALMSGVMIKIGVFGIIKVAIDLLGGGPVWWGVLLLAAGAVSAVLGIAYALPARDIKQMLAYSSVENIGIILLGVGTALIGVAMRQPVVAVLGLMAALYHVVNHAVFKALLFLGAGALIHRTHTKDIEAMGGLGRTMPWTALSFLVGALAITAAPPLNGFVSEWYSYQALFAASLQGGLPARLTAPLAAAMLALTGALAVMCFVKAYGLIVSGKPRRADAPTREAPLPMLIALGLLAAASIALGLLSPIIAPVLASIAAATLGTAPITAVSGALLLSPAGQQMTVSPPLLALLMLILGMLPIVITAAFAAQRASPRRAAAPWATGYQPDAHMALTGRSMAQPIQFILAPLYRLRAHMDGARGASRDGFAGLVHAAADAETGWDRGIIGPLCRCVQSLGERMQLLQGGDLRVYCLYILAALVLLMGAAVL